MLRSKTAIILVFIFCFKAQASGILVMDLRSNLSAAKAYCEQQKNCRVLETKTKEFSNDNTFVKFSESVSNLAVHLVLPEKLTDQDLMEALIKVRTAKTQNAHDIGLIFPEASPEASMVTSLDQLSFLADLPLNYLYTAGAKWVQVGAHRFQLPLVKNNFPKPKEEDGAARTVVVDLDHNELSQSIAKNLNVPNWSLDQLKSNDQSALRQSLQIVMVSSVAPPVGENFFNTLKQIQYAKAQGHKVILVTPYLPYARSDKVDQPGVTATGRLIADLIESVGTDVAAFVRLHAPQSQGFFAIPTMHVSGRETITRFLKEHHIDAIISPDAGFQKDATFYADDLKVPVYVINKQRNPISGESELKAMGEFNLAGLNLAIIDDETASGSTLGSAAEFLKSKGAKSVLGVVTHLAGKADKAIENKALDKVVVTNTFPIKVPESDRFVVLSIGEEIAENLKSIINKKNCEIYLSNQSKDQK